MPQEFKSKHKRDRAQLRTFKVIQQQKRKEQFFAQILNELQSQFPKEHLDFYIESSTRNFYTNLALQKLFIERAGQSLQPESTQKEAEDTNCSEQNQFKKIDPLLFQNIKNLQLSTKGPKLSFPQQRKCLATPKGRQSVVQKMPRKMFEVDSKMRKNYERVKERIFFNTPETSFRATNSVRNSMACHPRMTKTQRAFRYNTECLDEPGEVTKVPQMLLGELGFRRSETKDLSSLIGKGEKDRRWECFGCDSGGWLRRYKCRQ